MSTRWYGGGRRATEVLSEMSQAFSHEIEWEYIAIEPWTVYATAFRDVAKGEPTFLINQSVAPPSGTYLASCRTERAEQRELRVTVERRQAGNRRGSTRVVMTALDDAADAGAAVSPMPGTVALTFLAWLPVATDDLPA